MMTADEIEATKVEAVEQLATLMKANKAWVDGWLANQPTSVMPNLMVSLMTPPSAEPKIECFALMVPFNTDLEKRVAMHQIGAKIYGQRSVPLAVSLAAETWRSKNIEHPDGSRRYLLPEDDPERDEAISVFAMSLGQVNAFSARAVNRDAQNRILPAGDWEDADGTVTLRLAILHHFWRGFFQPVMARNHTPT